MNETVYSRQHMREHRIDTTAYKINTDPGVFQATLEMKAEAHSGMLRVFFSFSDGRKVIAPVYYWQRYLGFYEMPIGTTVILTYEEKATGTYLTEARIA